MNNIPFIFPEKTLEAQAYFRFFHKGMGEVDRSKFRSILYGDNDVIMFE